MAHTNQSRIVDEARSSVSFDEGVGSGVADVVSGISWMAKSGELAPPWWSTTRDRYLSNFWKGSNHLSLAIYNAQSKLAGVPFLIEARDPSVIKHQRQAEAIQESLIIGSELGEGIGTTFDRFYEDLLTQDNGGFMEILGDGPPDGPISGTPIAVRHLDSQRCTRTSNPVYPVIYESSEGGRFKLHWTRVIYMSQMTSPRQSMLGVGVCAVSRALDIAQTAVDVIRYKQERLGSRPPNQLIVGKGIKGKTIMEAIRRAESEMSNRGLNRYSRSVAIGSDMTDIDVDIKNLHHIEPFDEQTSITFAMYGIASAFGLDVTEIWPVAGAQGSGDAAKLQNMRARGKLPAQATAEMSHQFNTKFLPPYLEMRFDFRDDEEDQQRAVISDIRARRRERDVVNTGALTIRAARQTMVKDSEIPRATFREMEWESGRLEDGLPIHTLFFSEEEPHATYLNLGVSNPLDFGSIDMENMKSTVAQAKSDVLKAMNGTRSVPLLSALKQDWHLLEWYEEKLESVQMTANLMQAEEEEEEEDPGEGERETSDDDAQGEGRSSMGQERRPGMQKDKRGGLFGWLSALTP